jgi:DNA-binding transcriptional MerR regulator
MKIGELARSTGQTTKTIRFYEAEGLLPDPRRTPSGYRIYGDPDIKRLRFIRMAKRLGLSLEEIRGILRLHDRREPTCTHVRSLLEDKLAQIDRALAELQAFHSEITRLKDEAGDLADCRTSGGGICAIIEGSAIQRKTNG